MNRSSNISSRFILGSGGILLLLAIWSACLEMTGPVSEEVQLQADGQEVSFRLRSRGTAGEFYAARKEQHIQRLLKGVGVELQNRDKLLQSDYLSRQVGVMAIEDVPLVWERLDEGMRQSEFGVLLLRRWAENDPFMAARWVQQLPAGEEKNLLLAQVAVAWCGQDIKGAVAWATGLPESASQSSAVMAVAEEAIRVDPFSALELTAQLAPGAERDQLTLRAINEWASHEPVEALRWTAQISDPAWQQQVRNSLIPVIASIDGAAGARLAGAWLGAGPEQRLVMVAVVQRWAQESPEAAAEWVKRFPAGAMRVAALDNLKRLEEVHKTDLEASPLIP